MIVYKEELLQNAEEQLIAHGCNAQGVMRSGVAAAVRQFWPEAFDVYERQDNMYVLAMGSVIYAEARGKIIANCITQQYYGRDNRKYVSYDAVRSCLDTLNQDMEAENIYSIAMPKIGAGLGGGDWEIIQQIIKDEFDDAVTVFIYDPKL